TCQDEAPFTSATAIAEGREHLDSRYRLAFDANGLLQACAVWDVPAAPAVENEPVVSRIPTLVLSGAFDPVTPPAYGTLAAEGLERAQEFVLGDESHGASLGACGRELVVDFLEEPENPLNLGCATLS